ncbi:MAG: hypothetical protein BGO68_01635 [Candidatus Amoebophilus sp. 36-38]|nr:MAG: hypothetical protein BGO68_01635 [Candidatus Amoebophilus sp. 36-38]
MKKYCLLLFFAAMATYSFGQDQFSIKVSPGVSYNRIYTDNPNKNDFGSEGIGLRGKLGIVYDRLIKEHYYVSTGAFFLAKQLGIKHVSSEKIIKEQYEIQYLQILLLLKLYTSEITLDTKIYFEIGITGALKINRRITKLTGEDQPMTKLRWWEIGGLFGCGVEYDISLFTSIFAGISYQPALSSILLPQDSNSNLPKLFGYADLVTVDIGIRF